VPGLNPGHPAILTTMKNLEEIGDQLSDLPVSEGSVITVNINLLTAVQEILENIKSQDVRIKELEEVLGKIPEETGELTIDCKHGS